MKTTTEVSGATDAEQHPPGIVCDGANFMMINFNRRGGVLGLLTLFLATGVGCALLSTGGGGSGGANQVPDTVPDFDAASFTNPTLIDNTFFPQLPGTTHTYEAETDEGTERIVVEVLDDTREVMGVTCRVVRDRVFVDDLLIEDTHDWYAQDDDGNVWYVGEEVINYEYDDEGNVVATDNEGAWEAGLDVAGLGSTALPGYLMTASPTPGDIYHQEYYVGEAEDMGEVVALDVSVTLSNGTTYTCLKTRDINPLEPDDAEYKYYAPGIGVVLEELIEGDERVELISIETAE
ncbi:MAG: hypothetical protein ACYTFA_13995 [Planctomycetota bacterium]